MLLSLESLIVVGAFVVPVTGATRVSASGQGRIGRPGSKNMGKRESGFPRNLGDPAVSTEETRAGTPGDQPQARRCHTHRRRERNMRVPVVPPSEGNEVRRDGRQEVAVP